MALRFAIFSLLVTAPTAYLQAQDNVVYGGLDVTEKSTAVYIGGVKATNGNIATNGFVLGGFLSGAKYDYDTTGVNNTIDVDAVTVNTVVGYQWVKPSHSVALYTGLDYQDHSLNPDDPNTSVKGDDAGVMAQLEILKYNSLVEGSFIARASDVFGSYWARGRMGRQLGKAKVGVELTGLGNDSYSNRRYGLYAIYPVSLRTGLDFGLGQSEITGKNSVQDSDSAYGSVGFITSF